MRTIAAILLAFLLSGAAVVGQVSSATTAGVDAGSFRYFDRPVDADLYLMRPGDELRVTFINAQLAPLTLTLDAENRIVDRTLGVFDLTGKTLSSARLALRDVLARLYHVDQIAISVSGPSRVGIQVTGAVNSPGLYIGYTSQRVSEMIDSAGGIQADGSRRWIVFSGGPQDIPIDLDRALYLGDERYNPPLYAGYTIYVPARSDRVVNVVGEVNVPREVEWVEGDSLTMLLKLAGGLLTEAAGDQIRVIRGAEAFDASQVIPMAGDIIDVPLNTALSETHSVVIYGAVRNPGHYDYRAGETPAQLTARAGGLATEAAPQRTTVFRLAVNDEYGRSSKVRYPIESPVGGGYKAAGLMLNPGDSVFVPSLIGYVKVSGEVRNPGLYPYEKDLAAASYIDIAGGMLPTADRTLVDIFQRVSRITGTYPTGVTVHDGDEVIVRRREELQ